MDDAWGAATQTRFCYGVRMFIGVQS